jgi:hypothetical protein
VRNRPCCSRPGVAVACPREGGDHILRHRPRRARGTPGPLDPRAPVPRGARASIENKTRLRRLTRRSARGVVWFAPRSPRWADNLLPTANDGPETRDRRTSPRRAHGMVARMPFDPSVRPWTPAGGPGKPRLGPPRVGCASLHPCAATASPMPGLPDIGPLKAVPLPDALEKRPSTDRTLMVIFLLIRMSRIKFYIKNLQRNPPSLLMVRSGQRVRAKRGPMTGSAASRTMRVESS